MISTIRGRFLLGFTMFLAASLPGIHAQVAAAVDEFVDDMDNYNLVSLGNVTFDQVSDTAGGLAIDGAFAIENNSTTLVGMSWGMSGGPSLYGTGTLAITNGDTVQVNHGYASLPDAASTGWTWSVPGKTLTQSGQGTLHYNSGMTEDPTNPAYNPDWNWTNIQSQLESASSTLNSASTAGNTITVNGGQNFVFNTSQTSGVAVFNLNAALLTQSGGATYYNGQRVSSLSVNVPTGMTYVINVTNVASGASFLTGVNFNSGTNDNQLLWNFSSATNQDFTFANGGKFFGSVLAPDLVLASDTYQEGQLAVDGLTQNMDELDQADTVSLVAIPEPSDCALWLGALCTVAAVAARPRLRAWPEASADPRCRGIR
jgi:choice-of-anchor A domain-containing protein